MTCKLMCSARTQGWLWLCLIFLVTPSHNTRAALLDGVFVASAYVQLTNEDKVHKFEAMLRPMGVSDEAQAFWLAEEPDGPEDTHLKEFCPNYAEQVSDTWDLSLYVKAGSMVKVSFMGNGGTDGLQAFTRCLERIGVLRTWIWTNNYDTDTPITSGMSLGKPAPPEKVLVEMQRAQPNEMLHIELISDLSDYEFDEQQIAKTIQDLLARGADINAQVGGTYPLLLAAINGTPGLVDLMLANGATPNVVTRTVDYGDGELWGGDTPLHFAAESGELGMYKTLRSHGANQHAVNKHGETVLLKAANASNYTIIPSIIADGVDVNAADNAGQTALLALLEGFSPDADTPENEQPEMFALQALVEAGTNPHQKNQDGESALDLAQDYPQLVQYLRAHGFD